MDRGLFLLVDGNKQPQRGQRGKKENVQVLKGYKALISSICKNISERLPNALDSGWVLSHVLDKAVGPGEGHDPSSLPLFQGTKSTPCRCRNTL